MQVTFIHTPVPHRSVPGLRMFWRNYDRRYFAAHPNARAMTKQMWELPHWMTWLGGVLQKEGFSELKVLDFYTQHSLLDGIDESGIHHALSHNPSDVYLFSPMTLNLPFALRISDMIKALYPRSIVIFGGIVASPLRNRVASHESVDFVIYDRGEYALPSLLRALASTKDLSNVGNITFRLPDGRVASSSFIYPHMPATKLPFPKIDLFAKSVGKDIRYLRQVHSLGCPFDCAFCSIQTTRRKPDYFPIDRVLSEIRKYRAYYGDYHHIYFGDETFTLNTKRTLKLCDALSAEGDILYDCQSRLNSLADPRLPEALYRSGCRWIEIGLETANQSTLDATNKRLKLNDTELVLHRLRDAGVAACAFTIVGFPSESLGDMRRTTDWVCSLIDRGLLHASYLFVLVPYPGSDMYKSPDAYNMTILHHDFEHYHEGLLPVFKSDLASPEQVYRVFLDGIREIGRAMAKTPYLHSSRFPSDRESFGAFWYDQA